MQETDKIDVLDKGFVRLVDHLGSDDTIVQSARVSYGEGTKQKREDRGLIRYLLRNRHTSPFEQVIFTFHLKMPIFVARQWIRHRTARVNEISGRYSVLKDDFYLPAKEDIALQSADNKQGREDKPLSHELAEKIQQNMREEQERSYKAYKALIDQGVAKEIARINLPVSIYTEMYWQMDLHNLFHFLELRLDSHAQREIRVYAEALFQLIRPFVPLATEAFEDYRLDSVTFSRLEREELHLKLQGKVGKLNKRELEVFEEKLF